MAIQTDGIQFHLPYLKSWKRPRTTRRGRMYDPGGSDLKQAKALMLQQATDMGFGPDGITAWELTVAFVQSDKRKRDIDRMLSFVMDALEGALYDDDSQVRKVNCEKFLDPNGGNCVFVKAQRA